MLGVKSESGNCLDINKLVVLSHSFFSKESEKKGKIKNLLLITSVLIV